MTEIPPNHPRYRSLMTRERIVRGMKDGIVAEAGLIAHGRGEALDYLMGEQTLPEAYLAEHVAAVTLKNARRSVISVNGNTVVLAAREIVELAELTGSRIEVNLFHRTEERIEMITGLLKEAGAGEVLGGEPDARIPGLNSERGKCTSSGIGNADVILVPLEDGDRAQALKEMGKTVICIDLNPLSRTSRTSDISIADEVTRALENMIEFLRNEGGNGGSLVVGGVGGETGDAGTDGDDGEVGTDAGGEDAGNDGDGEDAGTDRNNEQLTNNSRELIDGFDNKKNLDLILERIAGRLIALREELASP